MKKITFLLMVGVILLSSCGREKKFDQNLQSAYSKMEKVLVHSSIMCEQTSSTWRKAIYDNRTPSGKYCSDFNDALGELFGVYKSAGLLDSISVYKKELEEATSLLNNHPSSRKDCYDDFVEIVGEVSTMARMATDPTGSLSSYNNTINTTAENISKKIDQFKIKYSESLKKDE